MDKDTNYSHTDTHKNRWSLLLTSNLEDYTIADIQKISNEFSDKCAKPSIYLENESLYTFDVIRKRRLPLHVNTMQCMRYIYKVKRILHSRPFDHINMTLLLIDVINLLCLWIAQTT